MSTKIHTANVSEHRVLEVFLTGGQEGDAPAGEELLEEVLAYEEVKAAGGDRAYDSDAIRAMILTAGKEVVIPPRCNRRQPAAPLHKRILRSGRRSCGLGRRCSRISGRIRRHGLSPRLNA